MPQKIEKFDPSTLMQDVKDRIKATFVSLIPDDQWEVMVKKEVDSYFKREEEGYGQRGFSSSFTKDVHQVLQEEVKQKVKEYLTENFSNVWYENGVPVCNAKVEELITKNAGKILSDMIGGTIQMSLQQAGYNIRS